ncbi:MAG: PfkB family carbohydrate kinase [Actinomycetota bacterium]
MNRSIKAAVVGHTEWIEFLRVPQLPQAGDIVHTTDHWAEPGGGGAVAAVQLAKLCGDATFLTAVGDDEIGRATVRELGLLGPAVASVTRPERSRRALTHIDDQGERTITVVGSRFSPHASDPLPWAALEHVDALYLTAGDAEAVRLARRATVLVATSRVLPLLREAGVKLDALVGSSADRAERYQDGDLPIRPGLVVKTDGAAGGTYQLAGGPVVRYHAAPLPGPVQDFYGCGDSFAAGLTFGLGTGLPVDEALDLAAWCGAAVATGRGPYRAQLRANRLSSAERS